MLDRSPRASPLYLQAAEHLRRLIEQGTLRSGDRVPSIRELSAQLQVSINTIKQAYTLLEDQRRIVARPQSGYYVRPQTAESPLLQAIDRRSIRPTEVSIDELTQMILDDTNDPNLVQFGVGSPDVGLLPVQRLHRMLASETRRCGVKGISYSFGGGVPSLREQIAKRMLAAGCTLNPKEIIITTGCMQAVFLALQTLCRPGDVVAVESPGFFSFLQAIEWLGLRALEIPSSPDGGIHLPTLAYALERTPVRACIVVSNFSNPLGACLSMDKKRELVDLLHRRSVPLIEDDIHGDLSFSDQRPYVAKAFDRMGEVLLCSSFSKVLAPGYRVGWIAPGRYHAEVSRHKSLADLASSTPPQLAIAAFLANGGYERHLRRLRRSYAVKVAQMADAIGRYFPPGTRVTRPEGGYSLWVEMPEGVDAVALHQRARQHGMTIAPGPLFSVSGKFDNCIRLNAALWSERTEPCVETLGRLAGEILNGRPDSDTSFLERF